MGLFQNFFNKISDKDNEISDGDVEKDSQEIEDMSVQNKLKEFVDIQGFAGIGVFKPNGKSIATLSTPKLDMKDIGLRVSQILVNSQMACAEMGLGYGKLISIEADAGHIIAKSFRETTSSSQKETAKIHIHLIMVLRADANLGLAKLKVASAVQSVVEEIRKQMVKNTETCS